MSRTATKNELKVVQSYQAKIRLSQLKSKVKGFYAVQAPSNLKAQQKAGEKKIALLRNLEQELAFPVRYGDGKSILQSLDILAKINENMAQFLLEAPKPKELSGESLNEYVQGIKKLAVPYQQRLWKAMHLL